MATSVSTYTIRYDEVVDLGATLSRDKLQKENDDLKKENAELRREIALLTATPGSRPSSDHTVRGRTPSTLPEKPFMRPTRASKFRQVACRHETENGTEKANKNMPPAIRRHDGERKPQLPSPCNGNASRMSSGPRYMQPTSASVRKKDARRPSTATGFRPTQTSAKASANRTKMTPAAAARTPPAGQCLDDALWQALRARAEGQPVPVRRMTGGQVSTDMSQPRTNGQQASWPASSPVCPGLSDGSSTYVDSFASSPMG
ncbi:hypothetical protein N657DRAFT_691515 [Parathielavia appendiculata]|uniref:Uncharacterized protein n=1 Tax=Parathielavia appendiculata TaxID=2587402 RepID=A0AAN6Z295_9PEZI|nr:hypothetical protein N657DRAFT_691515 [Parathielavia appendiculata]